MDGLDIAFCEFTETGGQWSVEIPFAECIPLGDAWQQKLLAATSCSGRELLLLHTAFGQWIGETVLSFIERHQLQHKIHLLASHGHTIFHDPAQRMTFQLGDGASIAAITQLPVVSDLRSLDVALGGQGAPIIPVGEKCLWPGYHFFLNLGGIANVTAGMNDQYIAFDVCAANRVLNLLAAECGLRYDAGGQLASEGNLQHDLLNELNALEYYRRIPPKSLSNEFGVETVYGILSASGHSVQDKLYTYCHHIAQQIANAVQPYLPDTGGSMLITGGGAHHDVLVQLIREQLQPKGLDVVIPNALITDYKEAIVMALIGVLRWREEVNVLSTVTGASRSSVGGALWMGQD